ncbi:hypothetical protein [Streptomyces lavendulocolor]|uniref:hypothetical protein n=1 Tax=Streptomyces lavendulocolor TaxID=67316 RepID=UPI003404519A
MSAGTWVLGVDSGGSGLRIALGTPTPGSGPDAGAPRGPAPGADAGSDRGTAARGRGTGGVRVVESAAFAEPVRTGAGGIDAQHLLERHR